MAIYRYNPNTQKKEKLTNKVIKNEIMRSLGLDPSSAEDQREYRRKYDIIRKKVKNYNQITPNSKPIAANEIFWRIRQRQLYGEDLTAEQENILNTPTLNTGTFKKQLLSEQRDIIELTLKNQENIYRGLLNNWADGRRQYQDWLNEILSTNYIKTSTGEIISETEARKLQPGEYTIETVTRRQVLTNPQDIINFFNQLATQLHGKQRQIYNANKSAYPGGWRSVGTP